MSAKQQSANAAANIKPAVIAFDVFGTLINIGHKRAPYKQLLEWMTRDGWIPTTDAAAMIMSGPASFKEIGTRFGFDIPAEFIGHLHEDLDAELESIVLYDDTLSTLALLKQKGFKVVLCSNLASPYGPAALSILPVCDGHAWSYEVGAIKPDPRIYQYAIDQVGAQPGEVLFIGDTPLADVEGPSNFGMSARLINRKESQKLEDVLGDLI